MADVLLFHHAHGLSDGVHWLADQLRAAGHNVTVPDLYEGRWFDDLEEGVAHAESVGFEELADRGATLADDLPPEAVYVGMSLGALPAQKLAQTRPGAKACVLLHGGDVPADYFADGWPAGVPLQVHLAEQDDWIDRGEVDALVAAAGDDGELFLYPADGHLFCDRSLPVFDGTATEQVLEQVLALLDRV
jgi:dienelactone hydrolase